VDHGTALFRLLYHVGLVAAADVDDARQQAARLAVHLDRYRLAGLEPRVLALRQSDAAVRPYLQPSLPSHASASSVSHYPTRTALGRAHTSAKAADVANLLPLNEHRVKLTQCRAISLGPT